MVLTNQELNQIERKYLQRRKEPRKIAAVIYFKEPRNIPSIDTTYIKSYLKDEYEKKRFPVKR